MARTKKEAPYTIIKGVKWSTDIIREKMETSDTTLKAGLLRVYSFQTASEKASEETRATNSIGFNSIDAEILSKFAEQLIEKGWLSPKQIALTRKKMLKYSRQIFNYVHEQRKETFSKFGL